MELKVYTIFHSNGRMMYGKEIFINHEEKKTSYLDPRLAFAKEVQDEENLNNFRQRFDGSTYALQILHGQDLSGLVAIVTGASPDGIGYEMARSLARSGCTVIFACRDISKAEISIGKVKSERKYVKAIPMRLDLASLNSVKSFVEEFRTSFLKLDFLILNAGIFGHEHKITEDNLELTFQVNYLSHFYLTCLLKDSLKNSNRQKVISISAESHRFASWSHSIDFSKDSLTSSLISKNFNPILSYNDSKLCCLMLALSVHRQFGFKAIAVHPGNMISSNISRNSWLYRLAFAFVRPFAKSLQQAAASGVFAAAGMFHEILLKL